MQTLTELNLDFSLLASELRVLPLKVVALAVVETDQDQGTGKTSEDVGTSTLVESTETFILYDLGEAVPRVLVLVGILSRSHHQTTADGVKRVGKETSSDSDSIAESELAQEASTLHELDTSESIVEAEVGTTVEDDTDARDGETIVDSSLAPASLLGSL